VPVLLGWSYLTMLHPRVFAVPILLISLCATLLSFSGNGQPEDLGMLYAADASVQGSVIFAAGGMRVMSGASVVAGEDTALLRLARGGEVRFCPRTTASVSSAPPNRNLMVGMSNGALEVNYTLATSADALVTPDFRILLEGPGTFHFAVKADSKGNTCVRALPGNTSAAIVTELMGDESYTVGNTAEAFFHNGHIAQRDDLAPADCGCPAPPPVIRVNNTPAPTPVASEAAKPPSVEAIRVLTNEEIARLRVQEEALAEAAAPVNLPPEIHVEMESPFIYRAQDIPPSPLELVSRLHIGHVPRFRQEVVLEPPRPEWPEPVPIAPARPQIAQKKGVFTRIGSFFAAIFH